MVRDGPAGRRECKQSRFGRRKARLMALSVSPVIFESEWRRPPVGFPEISAIHSRPHSKLFFWGKQAKDGDHSNKLRWLDFRNYASR